MIGIRMAIRRAAALGVGLAVTAAADDSRLVLKDWTGRGFAPDRVRYQWTLPGNPSHWRLYGPGDDPAPMQISTDGDGHTNLAFVASIPPGGTHVYRLRHHPASPVPSSPVHARRRGRTWELVSDRLALRVPGPADRHFRKPVPANRLPAPILAFRSGDNPWMGRGRMLTSRRVTAYRMRVMASGPVYVQTRYALDFEGGGFYRADVRVTLQSPLVHVREEFDAGERDGSDYWALDLTEGWSPDLMEVATTMGNSGVDNGQTLPLTELGPTPDPVTARWMIVPDSAWHTPRSQFGLLRSQDHVREEERNREGRVVRVWDTLRDGAPMAGFVPLHKGDWRRTTGVEIHTPDCRRVALHLPMSVRHARSATETTSETGVHSFHEHDPALPPTYGRRVWGLVLAPPALRSVAEVERPAGPFYQARLFYGIVGLDRYKDFILDWPDTGIEYPRVFLTSDAAKRVRETLDRSPVADRLRHGWYLMSADPDVARKRVPEVRRGLGYLAHFMMISPTVGHHKMANAYVHAAAAEDVLSWPDLPPDDRRDLRARLALMTHLMQDADVMSYGNGTHTGNANMGVSRTLSMCAFMGLLPDHPMFANWRRHMKAYTAYKIGSLMAPGGAWNEFGGSYHIHSMARVNHAVMGLRAAGESGSLDRIENALALDWEYYLNLLTPFDSRWQARMIPGLANSPPSFTAHLFETAGLFADRDPRLAARLRWAWQENGASLADGNLTQTLNGLMERPWITPEAPPLASRFYPGFGVIFRAHPGPDETYMLFRAGFNWGHWYIDQGHMVLMSRGATLIPFQPYQYWHREWGSDPSFDRYNLMRFGDVLNDNPAGWPDGNVLDYAFGSSAEYAWASIAFPGHHVRAMALDDQPGQIRAPFTWDRQVMFLKGRTARSPNYFVFRDSFQGPGTFANAWFLNLLGRRDQVRADGDRLAVSTEWPVGLDLVFADGAPETVDMHEENLPLVFWGGPFWRESTLGRPLSPNWVQKDGRPMVLPPGKNEGTWEQHVFLRIPGAPGRERFWIAYPRTADEPLPQVRQLAPGVVEIRTPESTDTVFLSARHFRYRDDAVCFEGQAGAVRRRDGGVELALTGGHGRVGYRSFVLAGSAPLERTAKADALSDAGGTVPPPEWAIRVPDMPSASESLAPGVFRFDGGDVVRYGFRADGDAPVAYADDRGIRLNGREGGIEIGPRGIRFVVADSTYADVSAGPVGVRGLGPFDLTFADDAITGSVDGRARTLVCSRPSGLIRPMFRMDGVHWFAGHAMAGPPATGDPILDTLKGSSAAGEPLARSRTASPPSLGIAFGVDAGLHDVSVSEWQWPALPEVPPRDAIRNDRIEPCRKGKK